AAPESARNSRREVSFDMFTLLHLAAGGRMPRPPLFTFKRHRTIRVGKKIAKHVGERYADPPHPPQQPTPYLQVIDAVNLYVAVIHTRFQVNIRNEVRSRTRVGRFTRRTARTHESIFIARRTHICEAPGLLVTY